MKKKIKGIILAGGKGTRLFPLTLGTSKQLITIYDKPLIYYPLSILLLAKIKDILIIHDPRDEKAFKNLLGDGSKLGVKISYKAQLKPNGIAEAFLIAEDFIHNSSTMLILGDNIFYGQGLKEKILSSIRENIGATIFTYKVQNPSQFGVIEFGKNNIIKSIKEKPKNPNSDNIITGLYIFDSNVIKYAKKLKPSKRNELEISEINRKYLKLNKLKAANLGRGYAWIDAGNPDNVLEASNFIKIIENRQKEKIGCIEEVVFRNGFINKKSLTKLISKYPQNNYTYYIKDLLKKI